MIKKKLGLLASSILLASHAHTAIVAGKAGDRSLGGGETSSLVLGLINSSASINQASTYWIDLAPNADSVINGGSLSFSLSSAAASFLINDADSWFMFASYNDYAPYTSDSDNGIYSFVGDNVGTVYADTTPEGGKPSYQAIEIDQGILRSLLLAVEGNNEVGSLKGSTGDFQAFGSLAFSGITNGLDDVASVYYSQFSPIDWFLEPIETQIMSAQGGELSAWFEGTTFNVGSPVPVPATAWLFGSALTGLLWRKSKVS